MYIVPVKTKLSNYVPPLTPLSPKYCNMLALAVVELGIGTTKIPSLRSTSHYSILDKLVFDPVDISPCPEILLQQHLYAAKKTDWLGEEAKKNNKKNPTLYSFLSPHCVDSLQSFQWCARIRL